MAEKRFTVVVYDDKAINGFAVLDLQKPNNTLRLKYESVYIGSKEGCEIVCGFGNSLAEENKELQVQCNLLREQSNEFHRGARENANGVGQLEKENKELKEENEQLKNKIDVLEDDNETYHKSLEKLNLYTKRFIPTKCTNEFKDCKTNRYYWLDHEGNFEGCLELLNLLDCENEELKSENRQLKGRLMEYEEQIKR